MTGYSTDPVPRDPSTGKTIHEYLPERAIDGDWPGQTLRDTGRCLICPDPEDHPRHQPDWHPDTSHTVAGSPGSPGRDRDQPYGA